MPFRPPEPEWASKFAAALRKYDRTLNHEDALAVAAEAWPSTLLLPPEQAAAQVVEAMRRRRERSVDKR